LARCRCHGRRLRRPVIETNRPQKGCFTCPVRARAGVWVRRLKSRTCVSCDNAIRGRRIDSPERVIPGSPLSGAPERTGTNPPLRSYRCATASLLRHRFRRPTTSEYSKSFAMDNRPTLCDGQPPSDVIAFSARLTSDSNRPMICPFHDYSFPRHIAYGPPVMMSQSRHDLLQTQNLADSMSIYLFSGNSRHPEPRRNFDILAAGMIVGFFLRAKVSHGTWTRSLRLASGGAQQPVRG
jgi:hypothetical protein